MKTEEKALLVAGGVLLVGGAIALIANAIKGQAAPPSPPVPPPPPVPPSITAEIEDALLINLSALNVAAFAKIKINTAQGTKYQIAIGPDNTDAANLWGKGSNLVAAGGQQEIWEQVANVGYYTIGQQTFAEDITFPYSLDVQLLDANYNVIADKVFIINAFSPNQIPPVTPPAPDTVSILGAIKDTNLPGTVQVQLRINAVTPDATYPGYEYVSVGVAGDDPQYIYRYPAVLGISSPWILITVGVPITSQMTFNLQIGNQPITQLTQQTVNISGG